MAPFWANVLDLAFDVGAELTAAEEAAIKLALAARASRAARTATAADRTQAVEAAAEAATAAAEAATAAAEVAQAAERVQAARKVKGKSSKGADASDRSARSRSAEGVTSHTAEQRTDRGLTATVAEQAAAEQRLLESVWASEQAAVRRAAVGRAAEQAEQAEEAEEPPTFGGFSLSEPMKASGASFGQRVFSSFASAFGTPRGEPTAAAPTAPEAPAAPDDDGVAFQARSGPSQARGGHGTRRSRYGFRTLPTAHALAEGAPAAAEGGRQWTDALPGGAMGPDVGCKTLLSQGKATSAISCFEKVHRYLYDPYDESAALADAAKQGIGGIAEESLPFDAAQDTTNVLTLRHDAEMWNPNPNSNPNSAPDPAPDRNPSH